MAEQLALQQRLGDGGAVNRQERPVGPAAVVVDGAGDQFLAGAALAEDEDVDVLGGDAADGLAHLLHDEAAADDAVAGLLGRQHRRHVHEPRRLEGPLQHVREPFQVERLGQVVEGALLHGLDGRFRGAVGRDEQHRPFRVDLAQRAEDVEPGTVRQLQVEDDHVRGVFAHLRFALGGGVGRQHPDGAVLEDAAERVAHARLVVDDQQGLHVVPPPPAGSRSGANRRATKTRRGFATSPKRQRGLPQKPSLALGAGTAGETTSKPLSAPAGSR